MSKVNVMHKPVSMSAFVLFFVLALVCFSARAELVFRSIELVDGQARLSRVKNYSNPADIAAARNGIQPRPEEVRVFLNGEITRRDVESAEIMARLVKNGSQKISGNAVWLASNGGDIDAGMELGRQLRKWGMYTIVGKNDRCVSACVFAFMGGERRSMAGQLGIHRPFFPFTQDAPDRLAQFRHMESVLKNFVEELDFPSSLYEAIMLVPPETIQMVGTADLKRFYLEGISPSSEDKVDAASARRLNLNMFAYLQHKLHAPACAFLDAGQGLCEGKVQETAANDGAADSLAINSKPDAIALARSVTRAPTDVQVSQVSRTMQ